MRAEQVTDVITGHGEGPVWWPEWGGLRLVDTFRGDIVGLGQDGSIDRWHVADMVTSLRPRSRGGVIASTERGLGIADAVGGAFNLLHDEVVPAGQRWNDGGCDPLGNFWCGTIDPSGRSEGSLSRLTAIGQVEQQLSDIGCSNGIAWSTDGRTAYYADSPTGRVDRFTFADGGLHARETFATIDPEDGLPDGLCLDAEGGLWVAIWKGHQVRRYDSGGTLSAVIEVPVYKTTACTFGGDDLDELWISTSSFDEADPEPGAGALFRATPGVRGVRTTPFAG